MTRASAVLSTFWCWYQSSYCVWKSHQSRHCWALDGQVNLLRHSPRRLESCQTIVPTSSFTSLEVHTTATTRSSFSDCGGPYWGRKWGCSSAEEASSTTVYKKEQRHGHFQTMAYCIRYLLSFSEKCEVFQSMESNSDQSISFPPSSSWKALLAEKQRLTRFSVDDYTLV